MMIHDDLSKETKLSQALEQALVSGQYKKSSCYMCVALRRMGQEHHVGAVHDMVFSIHKDETAYRDLPLLCALHDVKLVNVNDKDHAAHDAYTTQLYCWWVFDLKRKGL